MMNSDSTIVFFLTCLMYFGVAQDQKLISGLNVNYNFPAQCSPGAIFPQNTSRNSTYNESAIIEKCQAFYKAYIRYAGEFTDCELKHSTPFRICNECVVEHQLASVTYSNFVTDEDLRNCRIKYMREDRVQVIPLMRAYMEGVWSDAACAACTQDIQVHSCSGNVNYTIPDKVVHFMDRFKNLSLCLNVSLEDPSVRWWRVPAENDKTNTSMCTKCLAEYRDLNNHYEDVSDSMNGNTCMDIVDRMNHTRLIWSHVFGCSYRSGDSRPVILIATAIAPLPLLFYGILRYVGKEKRSKIVKQKRLTLASASINVQLSGGEHASIAGTSSSTSSS